MEPADLVEHRLGVVIGEVVAEAESTQAISAMIRQSGSASPGGGAAGRHIVTERSEFTITPWVSDHIAAGRTTSAYSVVSVSPYTSWTTTRSARRRASITVDRFATLATDWCR